MPTDSLSSTLFALSDPTRRGILARLAMGDATVMVLAKPYDMSLAAVSKHLKVLEGAGLISRGRDAQFRPCHLQVAPLESAWTFLDEYRHFWDRSLDSLNEYLAVMQKPPFAPAASRRRKISPRTPAIRRKKGPLV